jgi:hypothetical protein
LLDVFEGDGRPLSGQALLDLVDVSVVGGNSALFESNIEGDRLSARARLRAGLGSVPHLEDLVATESRSGAELGLDLLLAGLLLILEFRCDDIDSLDDSQVVILDLSLLRGVLLVALGISGDLLSDEQDWLHGIGTLD